MHGRTAHPNIVNYQFFKDYGVDSAVISEPLFYIVSDFLPNDELQKYIWCTTYANYALPMREAICKNLFRQILGGLSRIHEG